MLYKELKTMPGRLTDYTRHRAEFCRSDCQALARWLGNTTQIGDSAGRTAPGPEAARRSKRRRVIIGTIVAGLY